MSPRKKLIIGCACGIGANIFWGFHPVVIRMLINEGVDPFMIADLRLFIGSATLGLLLAIFGAATKTSPFPRIHYSKFFWLVTLSLVANFLLFHKGLKFTIASDAILLEAFAPVMVLIITMIFFQERMKHFERNPTALTQALKIVIVGSIGSALLLLNDPKDLVMNSDNKIIGDLIEFFAMFAWALVLLGMHEYQKREDGKSSILAMTAQFLFIAGILLAVFVPWTQLPQITNEQWMWIFVLGVCSTGFSYILWNIASRYLDIFPLITLFNLASIFNVIIESLVLDLHISWKLFVGGFLILYAATRAKMMNEKYKLMQKDEASLSS